MANMKGEKQGCLEIQGETGKLEKETGSCHLPVSIGLFTASP